MTFEERHGRPRGCSECSDGDGDFLLAETGDFLLLEIGDKIELE